MLHNGGALGLVEEVSAREDVHETVDAAGEDRACDMINTCIHAMHASHPSL